MSVLYISIIYFSEDKKKWLFFISRDILCHNWNVVGFFCFFFFSLPYTKSYNIMLYRFKCRFKYKTKYLTFYQRKFKMGLSNKVEFGTGLTFTWLLRYCPNSIIWNYLKNKIKWNVHTRKSNKFRNFIGFETWKNEMKIDYTGLILINLKSKDLTK